MPSDSNLWQPANAPDPSKAPPLDVGAFMGGLSSGYEYGKDLRESWKVKGEAKAAAKKGYSPTSLYDRMLTQDEAVMERGGEQPRGLFGYSDVASKWGPGMGGWARSFLEGRGERALAEDPMGAVKMRLNEQSVAMNQLKIDEAMEARDLAVSNKAKVLEFGQMLNGFIAQGEAASPDVQEQVLGWLARNPQAAATPQVQAQLKQFQMSRAFLDGQAKLARERAKANLEVLQPGESMEINGERFSKGNPSSSMSPEQRAEYLELARQRLDLQKKGQILRELGYDYRANDQALKAVGMQIDAFEKGIEITGLPAPVQREGAAPAQVPALAPSGVPPAASTNAPPEMPAAAPAAPATPATPPVSFKQVERPLTAAVVTELQKKNLEADEALSRLKPLERAIKETPEAFGGKGVVGEWWEVIKGQVNPSTDPKISKARLDAGLSFVSLVKTLRTDVGNMNLFELKQLQRLGDMRLWEQYPARALSHAETIKNLVLGKKLRTLQALHGSPSDEVLRMLPRQADELKELLDLRLISTADLLRWKALRNAQEKEQR